MKAALVAAAVAVLLAAPGRGLAQESSKEWPTGTVTLTQTFAVGGAMDFAARSIAQDLTEKLGHSFVVETREGGGGIIGLIATAKAPPNGSNFVLTAIGPIVFRPIIDRNVGFDSDKDFEPVIVIGETPNGILTSPKLNVSTIAELKAYAASHGNKLNIGHPGPGTMGQYCGVMLAEKLGIEGNFISYRGATPIVQDLLGGQIELGTPAFGPSSTAAKVLAISSEQRIDALPEVPTLREAGLDMTCATWIALYAPAGTPKPVIDKLNAAIDAFLGKPETKKTFASVGLTPVGGPPQRVRDKMAADRATWGAIITRLANTGAK